MQAQLGPSLTRYGERIGPVAFSPDSHTLATSTGLSSLTARLWTVPPVRRIDAVLCARAGRSLTAQEWQRYAPGLPYLRICP